MSEEGAEEDENVNSISPDNRVAKRSREEEGGGGGDDDVQVLGVIKNSDEMPELNRRDDLEFSNCMVFGEEADNLFRGVDVLGVKYKKYIVDADYVARYHTMVCGGIDKWIEDISIFLHHLEFSNVGYPDEAIENKREFLKKMKVAREGIVKTNFIPVGLLNTMGLEGLVDGVDTAQLCNLVHFLSACNCFKIKYCPIFHGMDFDIVTIFDDSEEVQFSFCRIETDEEFDAQYHN